MAAIFRTAAVLSAALVLAGPVWAASPAGAAPTPSTPASGPAAPAPGPAAVGCAVSGYTPARGEAAQALRTKLRGPEGNDLDGTRLERAHTWLVPPDSRPVVVVDSTTPLTTGRAEVYLFGLGFPLASGSGGPRPRYVSDTALPRLGSTVRVVGVRAESNACGSELVVIADRSVFDTALGRAGLAAAALFGALMVWVARRRAGGWGRRFALAASFGLAAGAGEAAVLQESGVLSPFSLIGWALPAVGLLLAAALPLTRRRRAARSRPDAPWTPPRHVALPGLRVETPFARTVAGRVDRAIRDDTGERVLVKTVRPELSDDDGAALRLAREAEVAGGLDDPHCLRLLGDHPGVAPDGQPLAAPVLIFEDVDGVPARAVLATRGPLTGPQACVVLAGALSGLTAVHAMGLVHRDVRPDNLFLAADGRILLAGFELAAPGPQNAVTAEGEPPYAGPQQRSGATIDARADLYAAGVMLGELMTGRVLPFPADGLPAPLAALISAATAPDPNARPPSADAMRAALVTAAEQSYGPDWMRLGALADATLRPADGAANPVPAAADIAGPAGVVAGRVGAFVTPVLVVAVVAAVGLSGAVEAGRPGGREVITPEAARVIFVNTIAEVRDGSTAHVVEGSQTQMQAQIDYVYTEASPRLDGVKVGVPRGQVTYPAYFWAAARIETAVGTTQLLTRFERGAADRKWLLDDFSAWPGRIAPPLMVAPDGYLAPTPPAGDLIVDPAELPARYLGWFQRSEAADAVVPDPLLTPAHDEMFLGFLATTDSLGEIDRAGVSWRYGGYRPGAVRAELVPFADGTVMASFEATGHLTIWNAPGQVIGPCETEGWFGGSDGTRYTMFEVDLRFKVLAWIPVKGIAVPAPSATGTTAPRPIPMSRDRVTIDDEPSYQDFVVTMTCP